MTVKDLVFTDKWNSVLADNSQVLFLEGPSQVSKTTLSSVKIVYECMKSPQGQTLFFLSGESTNTLYRNFIEPETGITKLFPYVAKYIGSGSSGGQRVEVMVNYNGHIEVKKIFFVGYTTKNSEGKVLGSKPYMIFADEFNKAHDSFVKAVMTRITAVGTKLIATSNGDTPDKLFYDYLNACRPLPDYETDVPPTTMNDLNEVEPKVGWTYYYFGLEDRPFKGDRQESAQVKLERWIGQMLTMHPEGSFEYNSKVLGIRSAVEGILYGHLLNRNHDIDFKQLNLSNIREVLVGVDEGSGAEGDKKRAKSVFVVIAYSSGHQRAVILDSWESKELGHVETAEEFNKEIKKWYTIFNHKMKGVYIENASPQMIYTFRKHIAYDIDVLPCIKSNKVVTSRSRVTVKEQMIHQKRLLWLTEQRAQQHKKQIAKVRGLNGETIDENMVHNDYNDATDYAMTPRYPELMKYK
jgi:hypothetical protein